MAFVRKATGEGVTIKARARAFDVEGDTVAVRGSARVRRPDGSFAETKLRWTYRFRDGLIDEINWQPRAGDWTVGAIAPNAPASMPWSGAADRLPWPGRPLRCLRASCRCCPWRSRRA